MGEQDFASPSSSSTAARVVQTFVVVIDCELVNVDD
jgi:hypothetical protein